MSTEEKPLSILRRKQVETRTGMSRSTIYDGIKANTFPHPVRLGPKSVGWLESEIEAWIVSRIDQTRRSGSWRPA